MKQTSRMLISLAAGLVVGLLIASAGDSAAPGIVRAIELVGSVWVSLLTMTVLPLVMSLLISSIASAGSRDSNNVGPVAGKALFVFLLLYLVVAIATALIARLLLSFLTFPSDAVATLKGLAGGDSAQNATDVSRFAERIVDMIPTNPFEAAADGQILPLVIFSILFGLAVARIRPELRQGVVSFFQGVSEAMLVIVRWVLVFAPIGIFAVVLPLAARLGFAIVGALAYYIALVAGLCILFTLALYPLVRFFGHVPVLRFARASAPAQSVALGTQSSLASLPAMLEAAERRLGLSARVSGVVLPLAVSVFRLSAPVWLIVASLFVAQLYAISLGASQIGTVCLLSVVMSIGGIGLPSGASYFAPITSVFLSVGLPLEAIPMLFAVDTIPDTMATVTNVTADMAVTTIVSSHEDASCAALDDGGDGRV
jgi:proton glutamate symport protein